MGTPLQTNQVIFTDETTVVKGMLWNFLLVRTVKHPVKVNVWPCLSSKRFGRLVSFKEKLNTELMCDICKHALFQSNLLIIQCYSSCQKTITDRSDQSTGKRIMEFLSVNVSWSCTHRKPMATTQDQFQKEKNRKLSIFAFGDRAAMELLTRAMACQVSTSEFQVMLTFYFINDSSVTKVSSK